MKINPHAFPQQVQNAIESAVESAKENVQQTANNVTGASGAAADQAKKMADEAKNKMQVDGETTRLKLQQMFDAGQIAQPGAADINAQAMPFVKTIQAIQDVLKFYVRNMEKIADLTLDFTNAVNQILGRQIMQAQEIVEKTTGEVVVQLMLAIPLDRDADAKVKSGFDSARGVVDGAVAQTIDKILGQDNR